MHFTSSTNLMRLTYRKINILSKTNLYNCRRNNCVSVESRNISENFDSIDLTSLSQNTILISESRDIYENLAFEDWLYNNLNFSSQNIFLLLMWYNKPSVVIGRHQNPWTECSLDFCQASGISIARRNSGGGTVYHDYGNLNCSFMSSKNKYSRKNNLQIICDAIRRKWNLSLSISERDDILLNRKYKLYIESKATASTRAVVKNLKCVRKDMNVIEVLENIQNHYQLVYDVPKENIFTVQPSESICPGITSILEHLKSWKWCFGHTPRFTVTRTFPLFTSSIWEIKNLPSDVEIKLSVNKGFIECIELNPQVIESCHTVALSQFIIGKEFSPKIGVFLEEWIKLCSGEAFYMYIKSCILQMILDVYR